MSSSLVGTLKANSAQIVSKLTELRQLVSGVRLAADNKSATTVDTNSDKMDTVAIQEQLLQENRELKQQIADSTKKLLNLERKRQELLPPKKEKYPLPVPKVISTSKVTSQEETNNNDQQTTDSTGNQAIASGAGQQKKPTESTNSGGKQQVQQQQQKKEKKESKPKKESTAKSGEEAKNEPIDASRLKLLVGRITDVQLHPDAEKLYVEKIDLGEPQPRTIISGLVDFVPLEQMQNRLVIVLANLKPAKMRGILSEGMVMCASNKEANQVLPLNPPEGAQPGDRVVFEKYPGEPDDLLNPKKKIFEQVSPDLVTDANGVATYKGDPFLVAGKGVAVAPGMANIPIR